MHAHTMDVMECTDIMHIGSCSSLWRSCALPGATVEAARRHRGGRQTATSKQVNGVEATRNSEQTASKQGATE